jgi:hypothetical protein
MFRLLHLINSDDEKPFLFKVFRRGKKGVGSGSFPIPASQKRQGKALRKLIGAFTPEDQTMNSYEDFLLNELAGLSGLDDEEIREILKKIEEERAEHENEDTEKRH